MKPIIIYNSSITHYLDIDGIVLFPFVLINAHEVDTLPSVMKHELTHVYQVYREGFIQFYFTYAMIVISMILKTGTVGDAFVHNKYEDEAYSVQVKPLNKQDIELSNWKGYKTDKSFYNNKKKKKQCKNKTISKENKSHMIFLMENSTVRLCCYAVIMITCAVINVLMIR